MTRIRSIVLAAKVQLATAATSPPVSTALSCAIGDSVRSYDLRIPVASTTMNDDVKAMIALRLYERAEIRFIRKYLPTALPVVELGASLGIASAHIRSKLHHEQVLVSVEANERLRRQWEASIAATPYSAGLNTVLRNEAISGRDGPHPFVLDADVLQSRLADTGHGAAVEVRAVTLSRVIREANLDEYFLVSDIEGAEANFIIGPDRRALEGCLGMIIEVHSTTHGGRPVAWRELRARLVNDHGYRIIDERGPVVVLSR